MTSFTYNDLTFIGYFEDDQFVLEAVECDGNDITNSLPVDLIGESKWMEDLVRSEMQVRVEDIAVQNHIDSKASKEQICQ
jgi:hypothetical protein